MITAPQQDALARLGEKYPDHPMAKFCERPSEWYAEALRIAVELGLHKSKPLCVLDIGCGFGYFVRVCRDLGHVAHGIDLPDIAIGTAAATLGVNIYRHRVGATERLPDQFRPLDLITTFGVNFRRQDGDYWTLQQYVLFTMKVCEALKPGGRWILRPNVPHTWDVEKWIEQVDDFANVRLDGWQFIVRPKESSDVND